MKPAVIGLAAALLLAGCGLPGRTQMSEQASTVTTSAVIEAVDPATRALRLRDEADGSVFTVTAGPEVRNFDQIAAGDRVEVNFLEATTLELADPADTGERLTVVGAGRAPEGSRPGAGVIASTSLVVEVVSYDADTGGAVYRLPDGSERRSTVPPNLRTFASARRPGDRVLVTLTDAVAVEVTPAPAAG